MDELYDKYIVTKADGSPMEPEAKYFVLRYDNDPHALTCAILWASLKEKWGLWGDLMKFQVRGDIDD